MNNVRRIALFSVLALHGAGAILLGFAGRSLDRQLDQALRFEPDELG